MKKIHTIHEETRNKAKNHELRGSSFVWLRPDSCDFVDRITFSDVCWRVFLTVVACLIITAKVITMAM